MRNRFVSRKLHYSINAASRRDCLFSHVRILTCAGAGPTHSRLGMTCVAKVAESTSLFRVGPARYVLGLQSRTVAIHFHVGLPCIVVTGKLAIAAGRIDVVGDHFI